MNTDADLLRRYAHDRDEPAFTALVQRHLGLVYAVALRRVGGDAHLAEDVAQRVFSVLARKAGTLIGRPTLSGWLYTSAHLTSAAVVRGERRRKTHETEAHLMQTTLSASEQAADWTRLRPVIDDVIVALKEEDREAIALRFFEKRSFAEVGAALRVTEEAARKRVDRALEKLRTLLTQRGIASTTAALGLALPAFAAADSPPGLGAKVAGRAFASAHTPSVLTMIAHIVWPAAAVLVIGGVVVVSQRRTNDALRAELVATSTDKSARATLHRENEQLAKTIAAASAPASFPNWVGARVSAPNAQWGRRLPALSSEDLAAGPTVTLTAARTIVWNNTNVDLDEFKRRLNELHARNPQALLRVRSLSPKDGAGFKYVLDEARQAKIQNISVENLDSSWWF